MCRTDCKSEPKLDFRPLNRCFKKSPRGFFLQKSLQGNIPTGKNEKLLLLVDIFTHHEHEILSYLNKKMNLRIFENPHGDFDLCRGIFSRSIQILSQKPIDFPQ